MRGTLQIPRVQDMNKCLERSSSTAESVSTHAKHNSTASSKKRKVTWNHQFHCARKLRTFPCEKQRRPRPSRARANVSPQRKLRVPQKTQVLSKSQYSNASVMCENEAFVRCCFLQVPRLEDVKTKLSSCVASFKFQKLKM